MNTEHIQTWLENFVRQSMLRRALVVSGNIIDLAFVLNKRYNEQAKEFETFTKSALTASQN